jgi:Cu(I)/Ag(I) efflux system membrane fusion protein
VPADTMKEIIRTRKVPLSVAWTAPRNGVVLERAAVDGMRAMPGDSLFRLADISTVWALIDISERDLPLVAVGQSVIVRPRGLAERTFTGRISLIYPQINKETRTARIRVELANPDGILRPGTYIEAEIQTGSESPVVTVPSTAVIDSGSRQVVILDKGSGRFEPRPVKLGRRSQDYVEVKEGIAAGDEVVVGANFLIDAESNLKAALRGLTQGDQQQGLRQ